jgi:CRISPR/Cas system Type II protein with McrA/HNH and RuvC-like nuclease domain
VIELEEAQILDVCANEFENSRFIKHLIYVKRNFSRFVQHVVISRVMEEQVKLFPSKQIFRKKNWMEKRLRGSSIVLILYVLCNILSIIKPTIRLYKIYTMQSDLLHISAIDRLQQ